MAHKVSSPKFDRGFSGLLGKSTWHKGEPVGNTQQGYCLPFHSGFSV